MDHEYLVLNKVYKAAIQNRNDREQYNSGFNSLILDWNIVTYETCPNQDVIILWYHA